ncbi:MAG: hypothetical protein WCV82_00280 [Candidatus Paceibacterota bacterium]
MKQVLTQTYDLAQEYRARITLTLISACVVAVLFYALNIYNIISQAVALEQVKGQITAVTSSINTLEADYLKLSGNITPDSLAGRGLAEGKVSLYIQRAVATASLVSLAQAGHEL